MLKNYLKIAWRNLIKNKTHTFINVAGLSVGMAVAILIGLWVFDELSYDKYFKNHDRIVRVMQNQTINGEVLTSNSMPIPLGTMLRDEYKSDFKYVSLSSWTFSLGISYGEQKLVTHGNYMQPEAPDMLSLKMIKGSRDNLKEPTSILISQKLAKALFGNTDPMDKVVRINNQYDHKVTGVYEDLPANTTFSDMELIAPWDRYVASQPWLKRASTRWGNNSFQIFAQLQPGADINKVSARIKDLKLKNIILQGDDVGAAFKPAVFLHPMDKWHLHSEFKNGVNTGGGIQFVVMFGIIGAFVLLLACINFMNLSTARSEKRAKEVGIRKTVGSLRAQLVAQFFSESLLVAAFAFAVSILLVVLALPWFNQVANKTMSVLWDKPLFWVTGIGFTLLTGIIAGSYPAFYLSSFQPVKVLKGTFKAGKLAALPRKMLVVLQFTVSVTLIIGTIVVFLQVQHTKNRPVGYNRTGLLQADMRTDAIHKSFAAVRNDLIQTGTVIDAAESGSPLTAVWSNNSGMQWRGKAPGQQDDFGTIPVSPTFGRTAGWKIIQGRDFNENYKSDSTAIIINEATAKFLGFKNPIGEIVKWDTEFKIIGVVKDLVMTSPYEPVKTTIFGMSKEKGDVLNIRLNPKVGTHEALAKIEAVIKKYDPASPFDYKFTDEEYAKKFATEERVGKLAGFFTILAIFISCLGLFGMASFMAEQRTKEIGVRKVLGASVFTLWRLMSVDFVVLITISLMLAIPTAYYFMQGWLQDYKYRTDLSWWIFAATAVGALAITLLTVSYQSIKAAMINPVKSLKTE
ncbi:FtsX-like permease family protein [Mucilaginibacter achroorhodeus]|uniref:FtsX-like permease family protein n=1 Tax=Mucilaginibacter achroorhodeus TaxID=2599294 RepID=A0A563U9S5_9SPHI|nr:ABC transporter permease [Mucilaginibacter achroorhodeus]TWR28141.1 FtsX-like permease family protein [Mucilaginibacter achroorhodeus]